MVIVKIKCVHCQSKKVVKMGYQKNGTPRCKCKNCGKTFQREYVNKGANPETKRMIIKMGVNSNFKKTKKSLTNINPKYMNLKNQLK